MKGEGLMLVTPGLTPQHFYCCPFQGDIYIAVPLCIVRSVFVGVCYVISLHVILTLFGALGLCSFCWVSKYVGQYMRKKYLSHRRPAKASGDHAHKSSLARRFAVRRRFSRP